MAKSSTAAYQARQIWTTNLAPFVVAAREGASQAAETARKELAQARAPRPWWRSRWVVVTATGVAVVGVAGGVAAVVANRRSQDAPAEVSEASENGAGGLRSTMEASREKVGGMTRNMLHRIRGEDEATPDGGPDGGPAATRGAVPDGIKATPMASAPEENSRNQTRNAERK